MHDYIATQPALDEGTLAFLLPALLAPFQTSHTDANTTVKVLCTLLYHLYLTFYFALAC